MIALVADERLMIQSAPTVGSEVVGELHAGDEITLAETVQSGGAAWVTVRLSGGAGGFAPGGAKFYKSRAAKLAQSSVSVLESPAAGSKVRIAYKRGDRFRLVRLPKQDWIHVWGDSGELGYIPVTTKVRVRKGFDCSVPCVILGLLAALSIASSEFPGSFIAGALAGMFGLLFGVIAAGYLNKWTMAE